MTPLEKKNTAMLPSGKGFPEDFELENEIDTYRFNLMLKYRFNNELFKSRHDIYLKNLYDRLRESSDSHTFAKKVVNFIILRASFTIPEAFLEQATIYNEKMGKIIKK
jgi:hypothetical protein